MVHDRGEVLVPADHERGGEAQGGERAVAPRLRPAVGVHVREQRRQPPAVPRRHVREDGLGERDLHRDPVPVECPLLQEAELIGAEEHRFRHVRAADVELRIVDVIGARSVMLHEPRAPRLELAVLEDREVDPPRAQGGVVAPDPLLDRLVVRGIGEIRGLRPLHHPHPVGGHHVAPLVVDLRLPPALSPQVPLVDVVVVGDGDARHVPRRLPPRPAPQIPLVEVVELGIVPLLGARRALPLVHLVAGEEEEVGVVAPHVAHQLGVREPDRAFVPRIPRAPETVAVVVVAGEGGEHDLARVDGVLAHPSRPLVLPVAGGVMQPIAHVAVRRPVVDAKQRGVTGHDHLRAPHLPPLGAEARLQHHLVSVILSDRHQLRGHLHHPARQRVLRGEDRADLPFLVDVEPRAVDLPAVEPEAHRLFRRRLPARGVREQRDVAHERVRRDSLASHRAPLLAALRIERAQHDRGGLRRPRLDRDAQLDVVEGEPLFPEHDPRVLLRLDRVITNHQPSPPVDSRQPPAVGPRRRLHQTRAAVIEIARPRSEQDAGDRGSGDRSRLPRLESQPHA